MSSLGRSEMLYVLMGDSNQSDSGQTKPVIAYIQNHSVTALGKLFTTIDQQLTMILVDVITIEDMHLSLSHVISVSALRLKKTAPVTLNRVLTILPYLLVSAYLCICFILSLSVQHC